MFRIRKDLIRISYHIRIKMNKRIETLEKTMREVVKNQSEIVKLQKDFAEILRKITKELYT